MSEEKISFEHWEFTEKNNIQLKDVSDPSMDAMAVFKMNWGKYRKQEEEGKDTTVVVNMLKKQSAKIVKLIKADIGHQEAEEKVEEAKEKVEEASTVKEKEKAEEKVEVAEKAEEKAEEKVEEAKEEVSEAEEKTEEAKEKVDRNIFTGKPKPKKEEKPKEEEKPKSEEKKEEPKEEEKPKGEEKPVEEEKPAGEEKPVGEEKPKEEEKKEEPKGEEKPQAGDLTPNESILNDLMKSKKKVTREELDKAGFKAFGLFGISTLWGGRVGKHFKLQKGTDDKEFNIIRIK